MSKPKAKKKTVSYSVPALEKGIDILEALSTSPSPLSQIELARDLNRSSAEIFRMLLCLEQRSYVLRDSVSGKYSLSLKLFELAHRHSPLSILLDAARGPMRRVSLELRENCHLSVVERDYLLVVSKQDSQEKIRLSVEVGGRFDLEDSTSGRLLTTETKNTLSSKDESVVGADVVAVRIGSKDGIVHAALAVTWLRARSGAQSRKKVTETLVKAAAEIHKSLGIE